MSGLRRGLLTRAYLHYLLHADELTALRLVTLHNLSFIARLMEDLRAAVDGGRLAEAAALSGAGRPRARCDTRPRRRRGLSPHGGLAGRAGTRSDRHVRRRGLELGSAACRWTEFRYFVLLLMKFLTC